MGLFEAFVWVFGGLTAGCLAVLTFYTVEQQSVYIIERFGKFVRAAPPGLRVKIPLIEWVVGTPNMRIRQLDVPVETKTKDNVFVNVMVSVQYFIVPERVYDAFYKLQNAQEQITSFVFDVVRAQVPTIILDDVFDKKDDIADAVKAELAETMAAFGYSIFKALVTDIDPNAKVKESMNEINAAQRLRVAAVEKGEADRILKVKAAEAESQSKALQGKGIADQRTAIINGLRDSIDAFTDTVPGASAEDVMTLVMMTQYFDTLKDVSEASATTTIMLPHSPGGLADIGAQIRDAVVVGGQVGKK